MPLIINEIISDIRIASAPQGATSRAEPGEAGPEIDRALRLMQRLEAEALRLTGRDEDDPLGARP